MKKRLGIGENQTDGLRPKQANVITNRDVRVILAVEFYTALCSGHIIERGSIPGKVDIPPLMAQEVMKALKEMQVVKSSGERQITAGL